MARTGIDEIGVSVVLCLLEAWFNIKLLKKEGNLSINHNNNISTARAN